MRGALGWRLWRVARGVLRAPAPRAAEVALGVITAGFVLLLSVIPAPAAAAVAVSHYDTAAYTYDAAANLSTAHAAVGVVRGSPGAVSCASPAFVVGCCTAANTAAEAAARVGPTTAHGAERIAGAAATRGGVLAEDDILLARAYGQTLTQADGATVRVLQNEASRFNVVVDGDRGLITTFSNLSQKSLERLATRYAWE